MKSNIMNSVTLFILVVLSTGVALAGNAPVLNRLEAVLHPENAEVSISWKSDTPVREIHISGGRDVLVIKQGIRNLRTNSGDFTGRHSIKVDSNYVAVQRSYTTERFSSVNGNTEAQKTAEPYQEVVRITAWVVDQNGYESEKNEHIINKNVEFAPHPMSGMSTIQPATPSPGGIPQPSSNWWENVLLEYSKGILSRPRVNIHLTNVIDGKIHLRASAVSGNELDSFGYQVFSGSRPVTNFGLFDCSGKECKERTADFPGLPPGTYKVKIVAKDKGGQEDYAWKDNITIAPTTTPQSAPTSPPVVPQEPPQTAPPTPTTPPASPAAAETEPSLNDDFFKASGH